ncbi:MAG: ABC transporter permease [Bacteroidales bacterium]|nr:ABC transporter permease [Bacteroidales bacterium]
MKIKRFFLHFKVLNWLEKDDEVLHPFRVILNKEISDHVRSWRFIILIAIITLTCLGSIYTALTNMGSAVKPDDPEGTFFFLKLFTISDGTLPSFFVFISFLGPLLGISLGFDAVNSEQNNGTLSHVLAQPIYRDYLLNAKFLAALIVISVMFFALGFLVIGLGLITIGIPPTVEEFMRIVFFILLGILYVAFWLNLSILFSVLFRQPATSALSGIAVWLFFSVFYSMIVNLIIKPLTPSEFATPNQIISFEELKLNLLRIMPNQLFSEATTTLLMPSVRSLGPLTMEQVYGTIPGPLPLGQSALLVWPQVTGLIAATVLCFVLSYISFMRREIRSR